MTKTYTEQWREGTLPENTYYVQFICGRYGIYEFEQFNGFGFDNDLAYIKEVLALVPSYDEYKRLVSKTDESVQKIHILNEQNTKQYNELCEEIKKNNILEKKLEIATKALKKYAESDNWFEEDIHGEVWSFQKESKYPWRIGFKALKEMEGVK